jgi:hypothetical protein
MQLFIAHKVADSYATGAPVIPIVTDSRVLRT